MSTSYIQPGDVMTFPAPTGGVTKGVPVLIGALVVIPQGTVAEGLDFDGYAAGVVSVPKADSQAWTVGARVYLDNTNHVFTTTATSNTFAGVAAEAVASTAGLTTGKVRLNGCAPAA